MKKCATCRYGSEYELDKPCVVYRADCPLYEKEGDGMNREEAIKILENERDNHINGCKGVFYETRTEAIDMAIKALEQETSGDLISRQYLLDNCVVDKVTMPYVPANKIKEAPSVKLQELCDNAISRQAVLDILEREGHKWGNDYRDWVDAIEEIKKLPHEDYECDNFGYTISTYMTNIEPHTEYEFCPNCGCRMFEPKESEGV